MCNDVKRRIFICCWTFVCLKSDETSNVPSVGITSKSFLFNEHYGFLNLLNDDSNIVKQGLM